jgi:hypothetical protein
MQVNTYISEGDYATLARNLPDGVDTVSKYMAAIIRERAAMHNVKTMNKVGEPIIPMYPRD